jgi:hypothetical protein
MFQLGDDALGGVALEIPDDLRQFIARDHQVQMVVQDDLTIELQAFMQAAKLEGAEKKVKIGLPGEEGNPVDHRAGGEIRDAGLSDGITAFHGSRRRKGGEAELRRKIAFPSWSLGTNKKISPRLAAPATGRCKATGWKLVPRNMVTLLFFLDLTKSSPIYRKFLFIQSVPKYPRSRYFIKA